uniref:Saposin B-type domain-containing protein n=1 Tax=Timema douglasi TaxID=61478 RepID=A0A7R8VFJ0_TIMDO|nr:unnamed protein product [Timema douglasi]
MKCDAMIATYGPSIINLMTELTGGRYICLKIGLCADEQRQTIQLLGGHRCTWGPGYWCQSQAHAAACKFLVNLIFPYMYSVNTYEAGLDSTPAGRSSEVLEPSPGRSGHERLLLAVTASWAWVVLGQPYPGGSGGSTTPSPMRL